MILYNNVGILHDYDSILYPRITIFHDHITILHDPITKSPYYCRERGLDGQHSFYVVPATQQNIYCSPATPREIDDCVLTRYLRGRSFFRMTVFYQYVWAPQYVHIVRVEDAMVGKILLNRKLVHLWLPATTFSIAGANSLLVGRNRTQQCALK